MFWNSYLQKREHRLYHGGLNRNCARNQKHRTNINLVISLYQCFHPTYYIRKNTVVSSDTVKNNSTNGSDQQRMTNLNVLLFVSRNAVKLYFPKQMFQRKISAPLFQPSSPGSIAYMLLSTNMQAILFKIPSRFFYLSFVSRLFQFLFSLCSPFLDTF